MNSPRRPDGPPVRDGKPYSAIAHLAEDVTPFVAMAKALARARLLGAGDLRRRPRRRPADDRGSRRRAGGRGRSAGADRGALRGRGRRCWSTLHAHAPAGHAAGRAGRRLPAAALRHGRAADRGRTAARLVSAAAQRHDFRRHARRPIWRCGARRCAPAIEAPPTWVLRDFHSPNLLWLPERDGIARVGLLDFQDAVMGPPAYDLASLLQDARVDVPETMEIALLCRYTRARRGVDPASTRRAFTKLYATLAAQRASKISRHFRAARPARRQAAIFASHAARMGLSAALAGASGAGAAQRLVRAQRAGAEVVEHRTTCAMQTAAPQRHGARRRPRHAHAPAHRHACRSRWSRSAARR